MLCYFILADLCICKRAQCLLIERVDVVGRCQRHSGAYRSVCASVKVSQFGVTSMYFGGGSSVDMSFNSIF